MLASEPCCGACGLRPSPTWTKVSAHAVDSCGALMFPPGSQRDDDNRSVVFWAILQRLEKQKHTQNVSDCPVGAERLNNSYDPPHTEEASPPHGAASTCWAMTSAASVGSWHWLMMSQISWSVRRKLMPSVVKARKESLAGWTCADKQCQFSVGHMEVIDSESESNSLGDWRVFYLFQLRNCEHLLDLALCFV